MTFWLPWNKPKAARRGHVHDGRSHCPGCALDEIGRQHKELADLQRQLQQAQAELNALHWKFYCYESDACGRTERLGTRLDAAIKDAAEQRALLLRIHKVCEHTLEGDRSSGWYRMVVFDLGQLTASAEVQEEGDDA